MGRGSASIEVDRDPKAVFDAMSDVTRMGEWSPECTAGRWAGSAKSYEYEDATGAKAFVYEKVVRRRAALVRGMRATLEGMNRAIEAS